MTVRWKPLLILSGLFVMVALGGLVAFTMLRGPGGTQAIVARARAERMVRRFAEAEVEYRRALQIDPQAAAVHEELAALYEEWAHTAPTDKAAKLEAERRARLASAIRFGPTLVGPRRALLADALDRDDAVEAVRYANEVLKLDAGDPTAHFVVAAHMLEETSPNLAEVRRHLATVAKAEPRPARAEWLAARVAQVAGEDNEMKRVIARSRSIKSIKGLPNVDALAVFRLRTMDVQAVDEPATLQDRVRAVVAAAEEMAAGESLPVARISRIGRGLEAVQNALDRAKGSRDPRELAAMAESVETVTESVFRKATEAKGGADLGIFFAYADHYRFRDDRARCLAVIEQAFASPAAARQSATDAALSLHALAVHAILTGGEDASRFEKVAPHIKPLLEGSNPRFRAFGHMYQGQVDLERFNAAPAAESEAAAAATAKARSSALAHLKTAANDLPDIAEAQARYGVALILGGETDLGRVYLQKAAKLGNLEPRYQIWAAWSMVQGGYPEYAEPIVGDLIAGVDSGRLPKEMAGILYLVSAEIHQAKRSPEELAKAVEAYQKAFVHGQKPTAAVQLRLAQIELMLNRPDNALARLGAMERAGMGGPNAEALAATILRRKGKPDEASARLAAARTRFPRSVELVALEAQTLVTDKKAGDAERLLRDFLASVPENVALVELRAWILFESLDRPAEARELLSSVAERSDRSSPLVRLAQIDLRRRDYEAVAATVAKVRNRWKEAAVGDMLDAQLALARGNARLASSYYAAALKKDPGNKVVQYWKARLDGANDPKGAAKVLESIAREGSVKEVNDGLSLMTAAESALANLQLETGDVEGAIARYQDLLKDGASKPLARDLRWKLISANVAKRQWPAAKAEIEAILADVASPPTSAERVAAAMYYRNNGEEPAARALLSAVLKDAPAHPWAVAVQVQMDSASGRMAEAKDVLARAFAATPDKSNAPVAFFLLAAAVENGTPPVADSLKRALAAIEVGLAVQPMAMELVQAKCRLLGLMGDRKGAIAFARSKAKDDPTGAFARLAAVLLREAGDNAEAERATAELIQANPSDAGLVASLIRIVAARSFDARARGDRAEADALNGRAATLIRDGRARFPADPAFVQLDCELAVRRGEATKAVALTQEIDRMPGGAPAGALIRAGIYAMQGRTRDVAAAYSEALERNPRQHDVRLRLAQADLRLGDFDGALQQARHVLNADPDQPAARLIEAKALASAPGAASQVAAGRAQAVEILRTLVAKRPEFIEAYHQLAEIHVVDGSKDRAIDVLRAGLKAVPADANGLSIALRILCEPAAPGKPADPARLDQARALAEEFAGSDTTGAMAAAASIGFHRAGQLDAALPWGEKAAKLSDAQGVHLNFGDLLLTLAESRPGGERDGYLARALAEFDRVLKDRPDTIEAVNNKAWILHTYMKRSQEALDLAESAARKADPASLPAEFYDTLGAIQEATGHAREAEESYRAGLEKAPDMPMLNFHMARLILADKARAGRAAAYLERAQSGRDKLPPAMAAEVATLAEKVNR